jgi:hypothetical protein
LKSNAKKTAEEWPDWEFSSKEFAIATDQILKCHGDCIDMASRLKIASMKYKIFLRNYSFFSWIRFSIIGINSGWRLIELVKKTQRFFKKTKASQ